MLTSYDNVTTPTTTPTTYQPLGHPPYPADCGRASTTAAANDNGSINSSSIIGVGGQNINNITINNYRNGRGDTNVQQQPYQQQQQQQTMRVLYSHQKTKKRKTWKDGKVTFQSHSRNWWWWCH